MLVNLFEKSENLCTTEEFLEEINLDIFNLMKSKIKHNEDLIIVLLGCLLN